MDELLFDPHVAVVDTGRFTYPSDPPFHPPSRYPESPFPEDNLDESNYVYDAVRQLFVLLRLDLEHYGTPAWNPLGDLIHPGDRVVLKPNLVISDHPDGMIGIQSAVVQGAVLRPFIDYSLIANRGEGQITIADSPIKEVDFERILELTGIGPTVAYLNAHHGLEIELLDFRDLQVMRNENRVMVSSKPLLGDPTGYQIIDLGQRSMLAEIAAHADRYRSTASLYENAILDAHNSKHNLYSIPNRILQADVVISLAKLKTHRKAGVTLSLKNMVGITNEKRWLPHHRVGSPSQGGDLYADRTRPDVKFKERAKDLLITHSWGRWGARYIGMPLFKLYQRAVRPFLDRWGSGDALAQVEDGDWYGNDTVWRMVLDLDTLLFYADRQGGLCETPQRRYFAVIDGIIGGMGEGPLVPSAAPAGVLVAGFNPVAVDMVCTRMMGFDIQRIPLLRRAAERTWLPLWKSNPEEIIVCSNLERWQGLWTLPDAGLGFLPSRGWQGHIELAPKAKTNKG